MHKTVALVFKVLAISILMSVGLDTGTMVMETISIHNKVNALALVMQTELARNNCIPDAIRGTFQHQLADISRNYGGLVGGLRANLDNAININGTTYSSVEEGEVKDYGNIQTLAIQVEIRPTQVLLFGKGKGSNTDGAMAKTRRLSYTLNYIYSVPCLRYLK